MSFLTSLSTHIRTLVDASPIASQFTAPYVFLDLPATYPCICIDGLSRNDTTKQPSYTLNLNLWGDSSKNSDLDNAAFYDTADKLQTLLDTSSAIVASGYVAKPEPENAVLRAQYICTVYPAGL